MLARIALTVAVAVSLTGCGIAQQARNGIRTAHNDGVIAEQNAYCKNLFQTPELDIIRDKVEFARTPTAPVPFNILSNNNYPTSDEAKAILVFGRLRDDCTARALDNEKNMDIPQQHAAAIAKAESYMKMSNQDINQLMVYLYQGRITYSDFAKKRAEISRAAWETRTEFLRDYDEQNLRQAEANDERFQRQQQNWATVLTNLQSVQAQRSSPSGTVTCTSNPMASGTMPNPIVCR